MVNYPTPQSVQFNNFKGIRTRNGVASGGVISAVKCENVDFTTSGYDAGIIIQTTLGNYKYCQAPDGYSIIKGFEFDTENNTKHLLFYCENDIEGKVFEYKNNMFIPINSYSYTDDDDNEVTINIVLEKTKKANAITYYAEAYNTFVFTNGKQYFAWCPDAELEENKLRIIQPKIEIYDTETGQNLLDTIYISGLALAEINKSLVIGSEQGYVIASRSGDITDFDVVANDNNAPWNEPFSKPITAIVNFTGGVLVFTEDDNTIISGSTPENRTRGDSNLGGCMSFESWVKHDKYLFFYDNRQKNIYYYTQNDYGQMVLGEPVAPEIQDYFNNLNRVQMVSFVGNNRSEIWLLLDSDTDNTKLIYDYYIGEWSERKCQNITSYFVYDNNVYSLSNNKCLKEKAGNICVFDGEYIPAKYTTQIINLGSFSNMKEMEFQPLFSVTQNYNNTFWVDCLIDGKKTKKKNIKMYSNGAVWADDTEVITSDNELWADDEGTIGQTFPSENVRIVQQVKGKFISNWYYLQFTIRTEQKGDDFSIACLELKGITEEIDTTGRK